MTDRAEERDKRPAVQFGYRDGEWQVVRYDTWTDFRGDRATRRVIAVADTEDTAFLLATEIAKMFEAHGAR